MIDCLCRPSQETDISRLKELWKLCFGDEDSYIDHYFDTFYRPERALVLEAEGIVCSMLLTFSFTLTAAEGTRYPVCYIYAFCTDPEAQGKGYGRTLLAYAEETARQAGYTAALMVPGEKSLFDFYGSLGYEIGAVLHEEALSLSSAPDALLFPISPERYNQQRETWLTGIPHISYDAETLTYQHRLCLDSDGGFYQVSDGIAAVETDEGILYVKELLCHEPKAALSALMKHLNCQHAEIRLPVRSGESARSFGVVKWLAQRPTEPWDKGWLAFGFD